MRDFIKKCAGIISIISLGVYALGEPTYVNAQNADSKTMSDVIIQSSNDKVENLTIGDIYPEIHEDSNNIADFSINGNNRTYSGRKLVIGGYRTLATTETPENTNPNYAYVVENGNIVQGELTQTNEMRWYAFSANDVTKISIFAQSVAEVDVDIYLFKLNEETSSLELISGSATAGLGVSEFCTDVVQNGIYYFAISAYEGNGKFAFAYYATNDVTNESNDTKETATPIVLGTSQKGIIDNPYDNDYYTFTLDKPAILKITTSGSYNWGVAKENSATSIYKISEAEHLYQFDAGTYYIDMYSNDGTYSLTNTYTLNVNKISSIANDSKSFYYMINDKAGIIFQTDSTGGSMYVNGNPIDISYSYNVNASNSAGTQIYDISMNNASDLKAKIFQNQFMFEDAETAIYYGMTMPDTVYYMKGSKGVGASGNVLELSVYSANEKFYKLHCRCTGSYAANNYYKDLYFVTVFIDPNTGKLVDIEHINYFYEYATGSNSMTFTRPYSTATKYYYPYYDGNEPTTW